MSSSDVQCGKYIKSPGSQAATVSFARVSIVCTTTVPPSGAKVIRFNPANERGFIKFHFNGNAYEPENSLNDNAVSFGIITRNSNDIDITVKSVKSYSGNVGSDFEVGDNYLVQFNQDCDGVQGVLVTFTDKRPILVNNTLKSSLKRNFLKFSNQSPKNNNIPCDKVEVPIVSILSQTTVDESDVGDAVFDIYDQYIYYDKTSLVSSENKCTVTFISGEEIKNTKFRKCCPFMVSVVKGKGVTLREKLVRFYNEDNDLSNNMSFDDFYSNILLYGMMRFILSRILYGKFDINFLLGKYYKKFIEDLRLSRFCGSITFFEDCDQATNGYEKYFKWK